MTTGMGEVREMACRELVRLVTDYLDHHLTEVDRGRFAAHLAECPDCVTIVAQFRVTIRATAALDEPVAVPQSTRDELLRAFRRWIGESRSTT